MSKLLYIQASPRGAESKSIQIADAYLEALLANNPVIEVDTIKLWEEDLLPFDEIHNAAKLTVMAHKVPDAPEKVAWDEITIVARRFIDADRYLLAVPMWNMGIPYRLKHYIDIVHQPGLTWGLNPKTGFFGLLKNKHATVVLTAGAYAPGSPAGFGPDHHSTYIRDWLMQAGVEEVDEIRFQPTLLTPDPEGGFERAKEAALKLAARHSTKMGT